MNYFSKNVKYLRTTLGLKQHEMLAVTGFNKTTWSNYEIARSYPNISDLEKIATFFNIKPGELLDKNLEADGKVNENPNNAENEQKGNVNGKVDGNVNHKIEQITGLSSIVKEPDILLKRTAKLHKMPLIITVDNSGRDNVIMVPVKARAGYLVGSGDKNFVQTLPTYSLPGLNNGLFRMFEVEGLSMYPTLSGGDIVICSNVEQLQDIRDDRLHVVITKNDGIVIKRVLNRLNKDGKLILKSDNHKDRETFPTLVVDPEDLLEVWYCTGFISRQMRPPAETYNRLLDLEARLTLLEAELKKGQNKLT